MQEMYRSKIKSQLGYNATASLNIATKNETKQQAASWTLLAENFDVENKMDLKI